MAKKILFLLLNLVVFTTYSQPDSTYKSLEDAFTNPENVYRLDLSGESLKKRHFKKFEMFNNLQHLDLSWCGLSNFPEEILNCRQLKKLNLDFNLFKTLPDGISQLILLEELSLVNSELERLPNSIGELTQLKKLNLKGNYTLSPLPTSLVNLNYLEFLYVKCSTTDFINIICKINSLKSLSIYADSDFKPCYILQLKNMESFEMIFHQTIFTPFTCSLVNHPNLNEMTILRQDRTCCPWYNMKETEINRIKSLLPNECKLIGIRLEEDESREIKSDIELR